MIDRADIHHRRSIRLRGYDYARNGAYFVTVCTQSRACLFGDVVDGAMRLNDAGRMVQDVWDALPVHYTGIGIDACVVMPNHLHGIIVIDHVGATPCGRPESRHDPEPCDVGGSVHGGGLGQARGPAPTGLVVVDSGQARGPAPTGGAWLDAGHRFGPMTTKRGVDGVTDPVGATPRGRPESRHDPESCDIGGPVHGGGLGHAVGPGQARGPAPTGMVGGDPGQARGLAPTGGAGLAGAVLSLSDAVHRLKTMTTKRYVDGVTHCGWPAFDGRLWQRNYYEHIVRDENALARIREYIVNNPLQWALDRENPACAEYEGGEPS